MEKYLHSLGDKKFFGAALCELSSKTLKMKEAEILESQKKRREHFLREFNLQIIGLLERLKIVAEQGKYSYYLNKEEDQFFDLLEDQETYKLFVKKMGEYGLIVEKHFHDHIEIRWR